MAATARHSLDVDGRSVAITNPDKVLYPSGFTKGQVIDYYIRIADFLLPHIRRHPVTLKRFPNGTAAAYFYEKNAPRFTPPWVETFAVPRRAGGRAIQYILLNDLPSVVWSANLANLEIHPFLARAPEMERPCSLVFDLEPGPPADVLACAEIAFLLKETLERAGLQSFAKVSGSKGMQVYAPLNTTVTYAETQPFARSMAEVLAREHPERVVSEMAKAVRPGKVFIDWSQNSDFKTTIAVYSLRAKAGEPFVSLPFSWEELRRAIRKKDAGMLCLGPDAALRRLKKTGDLFQPVLELKQRLPGVRKVALP